MSGCCCRPHPHYNTSSPPPTSCTWMAMMWIFSASTTGSTSVSNAPASGFFTGANRLPDAISAKFSSRRRLMPVSCAAKGHTHKRSSRGAIRGKGGKGEGRANGLSRESQGAVEGAEGACRVHMRSSTHRPSAHTPSTCTHGRSVPSASACPQQQQQ